MEEENQVQQVAIKKKTSETRKSSASSNDERSKES